VVAVPAHGVIVLSHASASQRKRTDFALTSSILSADTRMTFSHQICSWRGYSVLKAGGPRPGSPRADLWYDNPPYAIR
jgi:hypothetical protein